MACVDDWSFSNNVHHVLELDSIELLAQVRNRFSVEVWIVCTQPALDRGPHLSGDLTGQMRDQISRHQHEQIASGFKRLARWADLNLSLNLNLNLNLGPQLPGWSGDRKDSGKGSRAEGFHCTDPGFPSTSM